jgi:mono/diheme cytochrome c family protein
VRRVRIVTLAAIALVGGFDCRADDNAGASLFTARCAVCHQPQAVGIPGTFPSLRDQVVAFARTQAGRDYLVMVVTTGLMGEIKIGNARYDNVMPAQSGLSEAEVAAVLNYLTSALGSTDLGTSALTADDVSAARGRHGDRSSAATRALRPPEP